jgi:NAD(P)-dependent dehydrogenase (short-subunit alcohol dehydrogenase family)
MIKANGGDAIVVQADVTKPNEVERLVAETQQAFETKFIF